VSAAVGRLRGSLPSLVPDERRGRAGGA
jgi:hypothetical protein